MSTKPQVRALTTPHNRPNTELPEILGEYLERFSGQNGRATISSRLNAMLRSTGATHPSQVTTRQLLAWITSRGANNTVRARLSTSRAFFRWCLLTELIDHNPCDTLPNITKQYPSTYGKVQSKYPARFLTYDEAFGQLIGACKSGTDTGLRDEIVIRLGLSGMRLNEIAQLTVGDVKRLPKITWKGKGNKPRTLIAGTTLCECIRSWIERHTEVRGQRPDDNGPLLLPLISATAHRGRIQRIDWATSRTLDRSTIHYIVTERARAAGLGHVAPHDLRRTAASILHHATTDDGAHRYDLLDIQKILGHADPATTMRSYLDPMDTDVIDRAADDLD